MAKINFTYLPGDGIGPEVGSAAISVLQAISSKFGHNLEIEQHLIGGAAIDAMGELGTLYEDSPHLRDHGAWQQTYMYYLGLIIGGGTNQIQKNIISERALGMPKEPKVQGA